MEDGRIAEQGSFDDLLSKKGPFYRLIQKFGGETRSGGNEDQSALETTISTSDISKGDPSRQAAGTGKLEGRLIVAESERYDFLTHSRN